MEPVCASLCAMLNWISPVGRRVIEMLATSDGSGLRASEVAELAGCANRQRLTRIIARDGLPPLQELRWWIRLTRWVVEWERVEVALFRLALRERLDPAFCYRVIKKLTGIGWSQVRSRGLSWVLLEIRDRCHAPHVSRGKAGTRLQAPAHSLAVSSAGA